MDVRGLGCLWLACVVAVSVGVVASADPSSPASASVSKCCGIDSVLVESGLGARACRKRADLSAELATAGRGWIPTFYDLATATEVARPSSYELKVGFPRCEEARGERAFPVMHHEDTEDDMMLLRNGTLAHRLVHEHGVASERVLYAAGKYCVDDMVVMHNVTASAPGQEEPKGRRQGALVEFAVICAANQVDLQELVDEVLYPIGLSISMACLLVTFLLYFVLPQLRDLTGKFILGICTCLAAAFAILLVNIFGWRDPNLDQMILELSLHTCVVGVWLCLNCMGHHVWKIILSKSVFTRVTDGQRLCYYSVYVVLTLFTVASLAVCVQLVIAKDSQPFGDRKINLECLACFYLPVMLLLLVNIYFYVTAQRRIAKQMLYNRSMQHFQVNFDLYTKFLLVVGVWFLLFLLSFLPALLPALGYISRVFNTLCGPLVFCVALCRTRVAFLFKRYFCHDVVCCNCCCPNVAGEFLEGEDCKELSVLDGMRHREEKKDGEEVGVSLLPSPGSAGSAFCSSSQDHKELSKSLFNVRHQCGEVPPPPDPEMPVGRVRRLLKSNSLTALANVNWGWRKETAV